MAITDINLSGKVRADDGSGVEGAIVTILQTAAGLGGTLEATYSGNTDANGTWSFTETTLSATYDVKISSEGGGQLRYIPWSDEITLKTVDTSALKVRGVEGASAPIYLFADQADDNIDVWRINAADGGVLTFDSRASGSADSDLVAQLTITPHATTASSSVAIAGDATVGDDLSLTSDSSVFNMGAGNDFTITHDGTTGATLAGNPITITSAAASTWSTSSGALTITSGAALNLNPTSGSAILLDGTISVDAGVVTGVTALTSATVDATTDFTIGDTVITDGVITDSSGLQLAANLDIDGTADISGDVTLSGGADGALQFTNAGENSIKIPDNQASALIIEEADNAYITFVTTNSSEAITVAKATTFSAGIADSGTIAAGTWNGTDVGVAYGGTGASSLTDGGVLLGSGTSAVTAMAVLADSEMIVGDGTTDPVAESGATLRTSIGVGTGNDVEFAAITGTTIDATTDFTIGTTVITDDSIVMTPSASDTVTIAAAANGVLNITTVDAGGATAHMNLTADGNIQLTPGGPVVVELGDTHEILLQKGGIGSAAADRIGISAVDTSAGNTSLAVQSEAGGIIYVGSDTVTGAAAMTYATNAGDLTLKPASGTVIINQAGLDTPALEFVNTDVAHGHTDGSGGGILASTNTFFNIKKYSDTGGVQMDAVTEAGAERAFYFNAGAHENTDKDATADAVFAFNAFGLGVTGGAAFAPNGNIFVVEGNGEAKFLVDEEGQIYGVASAHSGDIALGAIADGYDDALLVRALDHAKTDAGVVGMIKDKWDDFVSYNEQDLIKAGILGNTLENGGLLNITGLQKLHNGAIWQGYVRQQNMQERLELLESKLEALTSGKQEGGA